MFFIVYVALRVAALSDVQQRSLIEVYVLIDRALVEDRVGAAMRAI